MTNIRQTRGETKEASTQSSPLRATHNATRKQSWKVECPQAASTWEVRGAPDRKRTEMAVDEGNHGVQATQNGQFQRNHALERWLQ